MFSIQVTSGSNIRSHVDFLVRGNVIFSIYMHVVRINVLMTIFYNIIFKFKCKIFIASGSG